MTVHPSLRGLEPLVEAATPRVHGRFRITNRTGEALGELSLTREPGRRAVSVAVEERLAWASGGATRARGVVVLDRAGALTSWQVGWSTEDRRGTALPLSALSSSAEVKGRRVSVSGVVGLSELLLQGDGAPVCWWGLLAAPETLPSGVRMNCWIDHLHGVLGDVRLSPCGRAEVGGRTLRGVRLWGEHVAPRHLWLHEDGVVAGVCEETAWVALP